MSIESTIGQEREFVDPASVTEEESTGRVGEGESTTTNLTERLIKNFKMLNDLFIKINSDPSSYKVETVVLLEKRLNQCLREITRSERPELDDVVTLADCFTLINAMHYFAYPLSIDNAHVAIFYITQSMKLLRDKETDSKSIILAVMNYYELSIVYRKLENPQNSVRCLHKALEFYFAYTKGQEEFLAPTYVPAILRIQFFKNTVLLLDTVYMRTLSFLVKLSDFSEFAVLIDVDKMVTHMHNLLKKSWALFEFMPAGYVGWAIETIQLAEYFLSCGRFAESKNHLCVASCIMMRFYDKIYADDAEISAMQRDFAHDQVKKVMLIIDMIWVKYGLVILHLSRKKLLQTEETEEEGGDTREASELESAAQSADKSTELLILIDAEKFEKFTCIHLDDYITNYGDVKILFVHILQLLNKLKTDALVSTYVELHAEIAHYTSTAYKYLAFYKHDKVKRKKLQKRRVDVLEDCLKILEGKNKLQCCIFIWLELAMIYSILLDMQTENLNENELTAEELAAINLLVKNSTYYLQLYRVFGSYRPSRGISLE